ncbi:hypothetical protein BT96DRAFT_1003291 [Gymnopus androsaceus JB14]|uniref:Uncharacterized protein n=1 Tax=Gymnopus androsaceus JB14 TaxID=1447944 RepID=A0A6A4GUB1_9AGAR|nr:hypothetical protein BT96DRAFT_1003291 [Gymnopus androsaceus JB14]
MFSKVFATVSLLFAVSAQINAHAIMTPALGVNGTAVRNDVQRPSSSQPCDANGTFVTNATDFNAYVCFDWIWQRLTRCAVVAQMDRDPLAAKVDPTGAGKNFSTVVTVSQERRMLTLLRSAVIRLSLPLPAGTECSGGSARNLCLVQFISSAGFGNCVVVQAASNTTTAASSNSTTTTSTTSSNATTDDAGTATTCSKKQHKHKHSKAVGTRAARALLLAGLEARGPW